MVQNEEDNEDTRQCVMWAQKLTYHNDRKKENMIFTLMLLGAHLSSRDSCQSTKSLQLIPRYEQLKFHFIFFIFLLNFAHLANSAIKCKCILRLNKLKLGIKVHLNTNFGWYPMKIYRIIHVKEVKDLSHSQNKPLEGIN